MRGSACSFPAGLRLQLPLCERGGHDNQSLACLQRPERRGPSVVGCADERTPAAVLSDDLRRYELSRGSQSIRSFVNYLVWASSALCLLCQCR